MNPVTTVIGFVPLVLFALLDGRIPVALAAAIGAVAAVVVFAVMARHATPALPIVQAITLIAMAAIALFGGPAARMFLVTYGRGVASLVLAAFILITVPFAPFTAAFARSGVPREHWHSPQFIGVNRRISAAWGCAVLVLGIAHLVSAGLGSALPGREALLIDWVPTIIAVVLALRYTRRTIAATSTAAPAQGVR